ncbi:N-terminal acetyltransferase A, auxiliary subunit [Peniophora sp. CONT]|nr:N-terminal acetyltransferase A, auxiliary subunit [Peniophora sp. CONT]
MAKRALPTKESGLFREVLNLYESRQYKKALKAADTILKKYPEHGETTCMKGLILTHTGRRQEGVDLVRKGIRQDLTSHIVWHVYGLVQKAEKDYDGALKSYGQALRFDEHNQNILRDAAALQAQLRHFDALVETRKTLLTVRPNLRQNWIGLAVAYYLSGDGEKAIQVLESHERSLKNVPEGDYEHSELLLFHLKVLSSDPKSALQFLDAHESDIVDTISKLLFRAKLLTALEDPGAVDAWRALVDRNPDSRDFIAGLIAASDPLPVLQELIKAHPRASAPRELALLHSSGPAFEDLARHHLSTGLNKGIPSLFATTKPLLSDPAKLSTVHSIASDIRSSASTTEPTLWLWTTYFLSQLTSHAAKYHRHASYTQESALKLVEESIAHTPTLPELWTLKGKILKRMGDPHGAVDAVEVARALDGQDRFLNWKSGKYVLRAGYVERAQGVLGLFTKKDAPSPGKDLEDMQSTLYLLEAGLAESQNGVLHRALKRFHAVAKIFDDWQDDQFDFHGYSVRRGVLNVYTDMLTWADNLRSQPSYIAAALSAAEIYIRVHDDPSLSRPQEQAEENGSELSKKARKKAQQAARKAQEVAAKTAASKPMDPDDPPPPADEDPEGLKLLGDPEPLDRAWSLLQPLRALDVKDARAWVVIAQVALRRGKYLQAVQALHKAHSLNAPTSSIHPVACHLIHTLTTSPPPTPSPTTTLLSDTTKLLFTKLDPECQEGDSWVEVNGRYMQHASTPEEKVGGVKAMVGCGDLDGAEGVVFGIVEESSKEELEVDVAMELVRVLGRAKSGRTEELRAKLAADPRFERATVFLSSAELKAREEESRKEEEGKEAGGEEVR